MKFFVYVHKDRTRAVPIARVHVVTLYDEKLDGALCVNQDQTGTLLAQFVTAAGQTVRARGWIGPVADGSLRHAPPTTTDTDA